MDFVIVDDRVVAKNEMNITPFIRENTFHFFRKIWFGFGGIPFISENRIMLLDQLKQLKLSVPAILKNERELFRITKRMLNKNKFYRSGLINLQLFCNDKVTNTLITSTPFREIRFPFRKKGILLTYSSHKKFSNDTLSRYKSSSQELWQMSRQEIAGTPFGNSIILNEKNEVCECIDSNIFIVKKNTLVTPSLNSGCNQDVLRYEILRLAAELDLEVQEQQMQEPADLQLADEIFVAGESYGLDWILGLDNKRYVHHYSAVIYEKLNEFLQQKVH